MTTEFAPIASPAWTGTAITTAAVAVGRPPGQRDQDLFERLVFAFHLSFPPHFALGYFADLKAWDPRTSRRYNRSRHNLHQHPTYVLASHLRRGRSNR